MFLASRVLNVPRVSYPQSSRPGYGRPTSSPAADKIEAIIIQHPVSRLWLFHFLNLAHWSAVVAKRTSVEKNGDLHAVREGCA